MIHYNVTSVPDSEWISQQIREAFPFDHKYKYLIRDNDKKYSQKVKNLIKSCGLIDSPTAFRSPWQNPFCERMIGSIRHELLDHVIIFNEEHFRKLLGEYFDYYHADRPHLGLDNDSPKKRDVIYRPSEKSKIIGIKKVGGLYHKYEWRKAA